MWFEWCLFFFRMFVYVVLFNNFFFFYGRKWCIDNKVVVFNLNIVIDNIYSGMEIGFILCYFYWDMFGGYVSFLVVSYC